MSRQYVAEALIAATLIAASAMALVSTAPGPEQVPTPEYRTDNLPEFIDVTTQRKGFVAHRVQTAGGLLCEFRTLANGAFSESFCEVDTPVLNPSAYKSLTASYIPAPPTATSTEGETNL